MNARIRLYSTKRGDEVIYDGPTGLDFNDLLDRRGQTWGIVDHGSHRMTGTFTMRHGLHGGRWWEFEQEHDIDLLERVTVCPNPALTELT